MTNDSDPPTDRKNKDVTSWYQNSKEWMMLQIDNQRIERLRQCRVLQDTLVACRKAAKSNKTDEERLQLEHSAVGMRHLIFFKWRDVKDFDHTCQREEHALWGCRATALQCGAELNNLKRCFDNVQEVNVAGDPLNVAAILGIKGTCYENKKNKTLENVPCREMQEQMGQCIRGKSKELAERHLARSKET